MEAVRSSEILDLPMRSDSHLSKIDALVARDFGSAESESGGISSGPGYFLIELLTSETFWADDTSRAREVEEQYTAELVALEGLLISRWGPTKHLDSPCLRGVAGRLVGVRHVHVGCPSLAGGSTLVCLGGGQQDQELPFVLLAAVTEIDAPGSD